jgi:ribosomal protein L19E
MKNDLDSQQKKGEHIGEGRMKGAKTPARQKTRSYLL